MLLIMLNKWIFYYVYSISMLYFAAILLNIKVSTSQQFIFSSLHSLVPGNAEKIPYFDYKLYVLIMLFHLYI